MGILSAPQDPDEMRYWREQASPFRFIYDAARARDAELSASGRKPTLGGLMSKEAGDYGLSTNEWEVDNNLGGVLAGLLAPVLKAFDAPSSAYQGFIPEQDLIPEVMATAGLAMGGGAASSLRKVGELDPEAPTSNFGEDWSDVNHWSQSNDYFDDFDFNKMKTGISNLGPHVGTKAAAEDRKLGVKGQTGGLTYPLKGDLRKPFNNPKTGEIWEEVDLEEFLSNVADENNLDRSLEAPKFMRQRLAAEGYTNIPYKNGVEDINSTSNIMLIDRPNKSDAVLRNDDARFDNSNRNLRNLSFANKSASGGLLSAATANELSSPNLQMLPGILSSVDQRIAASTPKSWLDPKFDQPQWHPISGVSQKIPASDVKPIFEDLGLLSPERQMKIEDLAGRPITPAFGDRTIAGVNILGVDDTVFDSPVRSQGGRDFMREEGTGLWASEKKPMTEKSEIVNQLIEAGEDPALIYTAMGAQSGDFSKIMMKTALNQFDPIKISNDAAKSFDERMAKLGIKNWPGTKSGKVEEALDEMTGTSRWAIWQEMDKAKYRDAGFPDINLARIAITDPKLLNVDPFTSGLNVGRPTGLLTNDQFIKHPSYEYQIGGDYEGGLGNLPGQIIWRDFFENRRKINSPVGSDQRSFMMSSPQMVSRVDDQMVEEVNAWLERQRRGQ